MLMEHQVCFLYFIEALYAVHTDISAMVGYQIPHAGAKNAGWLVFSQNHFIIIQIDLQLIPFRDVQSAPKLYRKYNSPQFINFSNDTG